MGFFSTIKKGFSSIGKGLGKAFGVVTAPIKEVWGVVKDTVQTVVHMPEKVLKSFDKATSVVGGLGNNGESMANVTVFQIDRSGGSPTMSVVRNISMQQRRFGHTADRIGTGPLLGAVLVSGGFIRNAAGDITPVTGAEMYLPGE